MQLDAADPATVALDLLARADELAAAATLAILAGDDVALDDALANRGVVIQAALAAWDEAAGTALPTVTSHVATALRAAIAGGQRAHALALAERDAAQAALATLDARQQAAHDYRHATPTSSINVVL